MSETAARDFNHLSPATAGLGYVFARPRMVAAGCVIVLATLGWLYLAVLCAQPGLLRALCQTFPATSWDAGSTAVIVSMWCAMTLAMMLPSTAPMILTYADIAETAANKGEKIVSPLILAIGYASIWFGFSLVAALAQIALATVMPVESGAAPVSGLISGAIFLGAGIYQFSALKQNCLTRCRHPFPFFLTNWTTTKRGVFRLGLTQGLYCLGCCWAMMVVMLATGAMNIGWMAVIGAVMTVEKMTMGRRMTQTIGAALIAGGTIILVIAFANYLPGHGGRFGTT